ncbi:tunicamycin resistance protein [Dimargaris xerosporica]|nr:tunicamycin resistance protein [Dimargaris xerosporica]
MRHFLPHTVTVGSLALLYRISSDPLVINAFFALVAGIAVWKLIPVVPGQFLAAGLSGKDANKRMKPLIPESLGILAATVYLICLFLFIPFPFQHWFPSEFGSHSLRTFPFQKLGEFLAAILCLQSMVFLGFADDVFDIRWRYKLYMPMIASIPLLMGYYLSDGVTYMIVPLPLRGYFGRILDIGMLYYVYIAMIAIFCTNSINILAGINGVEVGQSLVIAVSIAANDALYVNGTDLPAAEAHLFSLYFLLPFIAVSVALLRYNWYPARVFVGDTYCYFAGMTFAVVGILGHFSKTMMLFFLPQIFNFVYSSPQLFRLIPCPRHRMPQFNPRTNCLEPSYSDVRTLSRPRQWLAIALDRLGLADARYDKNGRLVEVSNLTLLNWLLVGLGPCHEQTLALRVIAVQAFGTAIAFVIRYQLVHFFY